jgi:cell division protein FtsW
MKILTKILIATVLLLIVVGSILVYSASGDMTLFRSHIANVVIALIAFFVFLVMPYEYYRGVTKYALMGVIVLLAATLFIGIEKNGATRWISLGFFSFQPSEIAKFLLVIHLANLIESKGELIGDFKKGYVFAITWIIMVAFFVVIQPNVSTTIIITIVSFTILYVGGAKLKHLFVTAGSAAALVAIAAALLPHARYRLDKFLFGETLQVTQAKIALGSGGLTGLGFGHSRQSDLFVPYPYGDFIYSILGEELGFIGALTVLFLYLTIFVICLIIAKRSTDTFGQLTSFGLGFMIVISAFINAGVVMGVLPTTGITLPFISFGGTSLIVFSVSIAVVLNIAVRNNKRRELNLARA